MRWYSALGPANQRELAKDQEGGGTRRRGSHCLAEEVAAGGLRSGLGETTDLLDHVSIVACVTFAQIQVGTDWERFTGISSEETRLYPHFEIHSFIQKKAICPFPPSGGGGRVERVCLGFRKK